MIGMKTVLFIIVTFAYKGCTIAETDGCWGEWRSWSSCSTTCHRWGQRSRNRTFSNYPCPGMPFEYEECSANNTCPGLWTYWKSWSPCNATCNGGWTSRTRDCYPFSDFYVCDGEKIQTKECNTHACVATWNEWSPWSSCTVTCGVGQMTRERNCITWPTSQFCTGHDRQREICTLDNCPVVCPIPTLNSGEVSNNSTLVGAKSLLYCNNDGYWNMEILKACSSTGEWVVETQQCVPVYGPPLAKAMHVGARVQRGRDWSQENQDGHGPGKVTSDVSYGWVNVVWDTLIDSRIKWRAYKLGKDNQYQIMFVPGTYDSRTSGQI